MKEFHKILLLLPALLYTLSLTASATRNQTPMQNTHDQLSAREPIHNMSRLSDYVLFKCRPPFKHVFITAPGRIEITFEGEIRSFSNLSLKSYKYSIFNAEKNNFELTDEAVSRIYAEDHKVIIEVANMDLTKNYIVDFNGVQNNVYLSPAIGGILDTYFDASDINNLGLTYTGANALISLWSPPAGKIELLIYDRNQNPLQARRALDFTPKGKGIWEIEISPRDFDNVNSLDGLYYQFKVFAYGEARLALDPYAKSMAAFDTLSTDRIGKAAIVNMASQKATPRRFTRNYSNARFMANETDLVAYEIHIRDFSIQPGVVEENIAGTFKGFIQKTDYLKTLGLTHVQFLPVNNFYTVDENDRAYKGSMASDGNYNWGYDPHNYFSLEGWFSTDARDPYVRIREYRELVQTLHDKNIGVIMDVVYNHSYLVETFENVAPGCYFRLNEDYTISGTTGAGPSLESRRKMFRKLMIESLVHFVKEYHIDGFRFDLMGFHDHETMLEIRKTVGAAYNPADPNELILQGEAWVFSDLDTDVNASGINAATTKLNYPRQNLKTGFFNDSSRDSYTGREQTRGFAQGAHHEYARVASGIAGGLKSYNASGTIVNTPDFKDPYNLFANEPATCLNYLTIHDGFTLWDKINLSWNDPTKTERAKIMRLASAMLFTSQGKIIIHGGDEILRTKPLSNIDKESHRAHTTAETNEEEGTLFFHENTYCSHDYTNMLRWDRLENEYQAIAQGMLDYYQGLIRMRRALPCLRYKDPENLKNGLKFLNMGDVLMHSGLFAGFDDQALDYLELVFTNGPASQRLFITGEVYPAGIEANPNNSNMYVVDFNSDGVGQIRLSRPQIDRFDLGKWGDAGNLNIKLVKTPGEWDAPENAYSGMGNNAINISAVNHLKKVNIDLSVTDFVAGASAFSPPSFLAYHLDNKLENNVAHGITPAPYSELIVIHNASTEVLVFTTELIDAPQNWVVILDSYTAGTRPLTYTASERPQSGQTNVQIAPQRILVPGLSSAVIAKRR